MTAFSRPALSRFLILYAALYAGFGVQSPYLPSLLESRDLRPEAIAPHAGHANRSCVRCGFLAPFRNLKVRRGWQICSVIEDLVVWSKPAAAMVCHLTISDKESGPLKSRGQNSFRRNLASNVPRGDRVLAFPCQPFRRDPGLAGLGKRHFGKGAEPHFSCGVAPDEATAAPPLSGSLISSS
jgi:hypothetical protein